MVDADLRVQVAIGLLPRADSTTFSSLVDQALASIQRALPVSPLCTWHVILSGEMIAIQQLLVEPMS
jgi:hypothetical protein